MKRKPFSLHQDYIRRHIFLKLMYCSICFCGSCGYRYIFYFDLATSPDDVLYFFYEFIFRKK
jgi:hypothetical protein